MVLAGQISLGATARRIVCNGFAVARQTTLAGAEGKPLKRLGSPSVPGKSPQLKLGF